MNAASLGKNSQQNLRTVKSLGKEHIVQRENPRMSYYEGLNERLAAALPDARHVLEIGCASGMLGAAFKLAHPAASWHGVDCNEAALTVAATRLDGVFLRDLNREPLGDVGNFYDCVVIGDALEHLASPKDLLSALAGITLRHASLVLCVPNSAHVSIVERLLLGDLTYEPYGLMDQTHVRIFSQSSLIKLLLDSGWWPEVADRYLVDHSNSRFMEGLVEAAEHLGMFADTSRRSLQSYQLIVNCVKPPLRTASGPCAPFSVVVPVNNESIYALNVLASPGLREVGADIVACRGHTSAASAFCEGAHQARHDWIIFCHQDVYFPCGSGLALQQMLGSVADAHRSRTVIGFAGIGIDAEAREFNAGAIVDRFLRYDWPAAESAISLDEFAVAVARDTELAFDDDLGWHLWATDLCLQAQQRRFPAARVERVLLFHNSVSDFSLPNAYHVSEQKLARKYPDLPRIVSLCSIIRS